MPGSVTAELEILKTACARARDQSMDIQRVASVAPPAKRQATEASQASGAHPSQPSRHRPQAADAPASGTRPTAIGPTPDMQRHLQLREVSKAPTHEQPAADAQASPAQQPTPPSTSAPATEGPSVKAAQANESSVIDLNAPATDT